LLLSSQPVLLVVEAFSNPSASAVQQHLQQPWSAYENCYPHGSRYDWRFCIGKTQSSKSRKNVPLALLSSFSDMMTQLQQKPKQPPTSTSPNYMNKSIGPTSNTVSQYNKDDTREGPAFIIERISEMPISDRLFQTISNLCIDVFFKEPLLGDDSDSNTVTEKERKLA
jgi:hypothetical protein